MKTLYVDMDNVCISGASYGGYAAMQAATKNPELFKCIIAYVGVYDLTSMDLRGLRWSDLGMPMEYIEKGDPRDPEDYKNLYENSPLFFAENVEDPVLIITGRRDRIKTLRKGGGLSGFTKRTESEYDPFGAAHSSTSISSTLGMAVAKKLSNNNNNVVAVIGDGAMSAGMAYEAMNNAGALKSKLIVVLNDNDMSIAKPVGAMSKYHARL